MALLKSRADLIGILDAAYAAEADVNVWARDVCAALGSCVEGAQQAGLLALAHGDDFAEASVVFSGGTDPAWAERSLKTGEAAGALQPAMVQAFFYPGPACITTSELEAGFGQEMRQLARATRQGAPEGLGLFAYPKQGLATVLWTMLDAVRGLGRGERAVLQRVAAHLDAALRLRIQPETSVAAVLGPTGQLLDLDHARLEAQHRGFAARVVRIEQARLKSRRLSPDSIDAWQALVDGRYSLVPREDADGKRYYLLVTNVSGARCHARLDATEVDVVTYTARGYNGKGTAYALGLSESRVSTALARAAEKLGLRSRAALAEVASLLLGTKSVTIEAENLTPSEREVMRLLRRGLSNSEIAVLRSSSRHTVANQVSSILRKTASRSRRALAVRPPEL
jgi:DNA-binding NarL/FixJ family response regulator